MVKTIYNIIYNTLVAPVTNKKVSKCVIALNITSVYLYLNKGVYFLRHHEHPVSLHNIIKSYFLYKISHFTVPGNISSV